MNVDSMGVTRDACDGVRWIAAKNGCETFLHKITSIKIQKKTNERGSADDPTEVEV